MSYRAWIVFLQMFLWEHFGGRALVAVEYSAIMPSELGWSVRRRVFIELCMAMGRRELVSRQIFGYSHRYIREF